MIKLDSRFSVLFAKKFNYIINDRTKNGPNIFFTEKIEVLTFKLHLKHWITIS